MALIRLFAQLAQGRVQRTAIPETASDLAVSETDLKWVEVPLSGPQMPLQLLPGFIASACLQDSSELPRATLAAPNSIATAGPRLGSSRGVKKMFHRFADAYLSCPVTWGN